MKKWVRWWGIAVFILIILFMSGIWYLLADRIIINNIEKTGEYIVGAKVEVGDANLTLIPFGISLNDLKVANPNSPLQNLVDIKIIDFHLDGKYLFERKIIIQDMVVEGLKFNTDRKNSGEIRGAKPLTVKRAIDDFILPILDLSELKVFIEQEKLNSIEGLADIKNDIKRVQNEWNASIRMMPNMDDMDEYRNRINVIISDVKKNKVAGLITHARGIKHLKDEIDRDINDLTINKEAMLIDIDSLETKKNRGLDNVSKDIAKLRDKYTPDIRGFKNFSKYIFKDDVLQQVDEGLVWYNKLTPLFDYAYKNLKENYYGSEPILFDGIDVHFPEHDPKPSLFVKLAKLSFNQKGDDISGEIKNFTTQQNITGLPTSIILNGTDLDFAKSMSISGLINHVNVDEVEDDLSIEIKGQKINQTKYKIINDWELNINNGLVDKIIDLSIQDGNINSNLRLNYIGTSISSSYSGNKNILINSIDSVLSTISNFYVDVKISGTPGNNKTAITSNLDKIVDKAVKNIVTNEAIKVNNTIMQIVNDKKDKLTNTLELKIEQLTLELSQVDNIINEAKNLLKELK